MGEAPAGWLTTLGEAVTTGAPLVGVAGLLGCWDSPISWYHYKLKLIDYFTSSEGGVPTPRQLAPPPADARCCCRVHLPIVRITTLAC
jgi:hypothetical protein